MAPNLNSFNPNPLDFDHSDDVRDHFMLPPYTNSNQNLMNESTLIIPQLIASNSNVGACQNNPISRRNPAIVPHGQLGVSQRMPEVRRSYIAQHRIQVHSVIDYFPDQQNQSIIPQNGIIVTEVLKTTTVISSNPTRKPLLTSNEIYHLYGQDNSQNHNPPTSNPLNRSPTTYEFTYNFYPKLEFNKNQVMDAHTCNMIGTSSQSCPLAQGQTNHSTRFKSPVQESSHMHISFPYMQPYRYNENDMDGQLTLCGLIYDTNPSMGVRSPTQQSPYMHTSPAVMHPSAVENDYCMNGDLTHPDKSIQEHASHHIQLSHVQTSAQKMCLSEVTGDGRTHSLPHNKYGPYTCPKCRKVCLSSQSFAAHVHKHYRNESKDQRMKRLVAKYQRKNLNFFQRSMLLLSSNIGNNLTNQTQKGQGTPKAATSELHFGYKIKKEISIT